MRARGWTLLVASSVAVAGVLLVAQQPTFRSRLEAVRVDVLVTQDGRPVTGLWPADFEIRDNGVLQQVDLTTFAALPLDVVLAFDVSESLAGQGLQHLQTAGRAVLNALTPADRAGLVTFSHVVTLGSPLISDVQAVRAALDAVRASGETALVDGSFAAMTLAEANAGRSLVLVFSDGVDVSSWLRPADVLETARRSDVVVYAVSTAARGGPAFLRDLCQATGGTLLETRKSIDMERVFLKILEEFRERYLVSYSPRGVAQDGWHELEVRVRGRRCSIKARPGYLADTASGTRPGGTW